MVLLRVPMGGEGRSPAGRDKLPMNDVLKTQEKGDRRWKKISSVPAFGNEIFKEQKLTIGLDLGDLWPFYCVRDEAGVIMQQKLPTTPEAMKQTFSRTQVVS